MELLQVLGLIVFLVGIVGFLCSYAVLCISVNETMHNVNRICEKLDCQEFSEDDKDG